MEAQGIENDALILNTASIQSNPQDKQQMLIYSWLHTLLKKLEDPQRKVEVKYTQEKLIEQLFSFIYECPGLPSRQILGKCVTRLFTVGETFPLFDAIDNLNNILKNKEESSSSIQARLTAIYILGDMYSVLGRMTGRSYEETVVSLIKRFKSSESLTRIEIMVALGKICQGLGSALSNLHREIYKCCRNAMADRVMHVRQEAAKCLILMSDSATFLYTSELENLVTLCFKSLDCASYDVRKAVANLIGNLMAKTLTPTTEQVHKKVIKSISLPGQLQAFSSSNEAFGMLMNGFLKGGNSTGLIKANSNASRSVRVGVTHCYVYTIQALGGVWLEKNLTFIVNHLLDLASHQKSAGSHIEAIYSRRCVSYIMRILFGKLLGEKAQLKVCEELLNAIKEHSSASVKSQDQVNANSSQNKYYLSLALEELGFLLISLGTIASNFVNDNQIKFKDSIFNILQQQEQIPRITAAWCFRCACIAVPSILTPLVDECIEMLEKLKTLVEAVSGLSLAISSVVGATRHTPLGIPHTKGKLIFNIGEDLLRTASQNSRLARERTEAGWLLIGSVMTLGPSVVKGLLPRMMLLWRNAFPRSSKELESEKSRGDSFTWKISLETRSGALAAIYSFLQNCQDLITDDIKRRISVPIESGLTLLSQASNILKLYQSELKEITLMFKLRLFETITLMPPHFFENSYTQILRLIVTELTLSDNPMNSRTSLTHTFCHTDDSLLFGTKFIAEEESDIESQTEKVKDGSGAIAIENDISELYRLKKQSDSMAWSLPLDIAVIDISIRVFGVILPRVTHKHRFQIFDHFSEHFKPHTKVGGGVQKSEVIQVNIFSAILSGLKGLVESKEGFGLQESVKDSLVKLFLDSLNSSNQVIRIASADALGRLARIVSDPKFVAKMTQNSFDCLKSARDVVSRTGHSLALGTLHHYVGGMGSSQHLNSSVSVLLALSQDMTSPQVQVWALHSLVLIADSGGLMFRPFVESTLKVMMKLLVSIQFNEFETMIYISRVLSSVISTMGPELQEDSDVTLSIRSSIQSMCSILQDNTYPYVQASSINCLQQLHLFLPQYVKLQELVPILISHLNSSIHILKKVSVACLRQFVQREASQVCSIAQVALQNTDYADTGLPGLLFSLLDTEMNEIVTLHVQDAVCSILQSMGAQNLSFWLGLLKSILTANFDSDSPNESAAGDDDELNDDAEFKMSDSSIKKFNNKPRWPTQVFAARCLKKIVSEYCKGDRAHYDLSLAKEMLITQLVEGNDYLVLYLSQLIRMAFMASTSESDTLKLEGLKTLEVIIENFGDTIEPDFPGHVVLEQYQAQVGAALRPAFYTDIPSHITSAACDVCSAWIGSGVARNFDDLRRVYQLLVGSLEKLNKSASGQLYNESAYTLESLSILKSWAEVYIVSMKTQCFETDLQDNSIVPCDKSLVSLVASELPSLSKHWLAALKDYATLSLPLEYQSQLLFEGGAFYTTDTMEAVLVYYKSAWPKILRATSSWLTLGGGFNEKVEKPDNNIHYFYLLFGVCVKALSNCYPENLSNTEAICVLETLKILFDSSVCQTEISNNPHINIELMHVLHRTILIYDQQSVRLKVLQVLSSVILGLKDKKNCNSENDTIETSAISFNLAETAIEVVYCILLQYYPQLNTREAKVSKYTRLLKQLGSSELTSFAIEVLAEVPYICSMKHALAILPSSLHLIVSIFAIESEALLEDAFRDTEESFNAGLKALKTIFELKMKKSMSKGESDVWNQIYMSSLNLILDSKIDSSIVLSCIALYVLNVPESLISKVIEAVLPRYKSIYESGSEKQSLKALRLAQSSIFRMPDKRVSYPFIHDLSPKMFEVLMNHNGSLKTESELAFLIECSNGAEALLHLAPVDLKKSVLNILIPSLVNYLLSDKDTINNPSKLNYTLSQIFLSKLTKLGQTYPLDFKTVLGSHTVLKNKLENALKFNKTASLEKKTRSAKTVSSPQNIRTIELTSDFSNVL